MPALTCTVAQVEVLMKVMVLGKSLKMEEAPLPQLVGLFLQCLTLSPTLIFSIG